MEDIADDRPGLLAHAVAELGDILSPGDRAIGETLADAEAAERTFHEAEHLGGDAQMAAVVAQIHQYQVDLGAAADDVEPGSA